jgi:hypothetical protein
MRWVTTMLLVGLLAGGCRTAPGGGGGAGGGGGTGGSGGGEMGTRPCAIFCEAELTCCDNQCVNTRNDIRNCGGCGIVCDGPSPYCDGTRCAPAPCSPACSGGQLCCQVNGPGPSRPPSCVPPTDAGTCPIGCPLCV